MADHIIDELGGQVEIVNYHDKMILGDRNDMANSRYGEISTVVKHKKVKIAACSKNDSKMVVEDRICHYVNLDIVSNYFIEHDVYEVKIIYFHTTINYCNISGIWSCVKTSIFGEEYEIQYRCPMIII